MKKILSIALALALCLTAMMGCFVVSAAANEITIGETTVTKGTETAEVEIAIKSEGVWAARFWLDTELTVNAVAISDEAFAVEYNADSKTVLFQTKDNANPNNLTDATITLTVAVPAEVGNYDIAITDVDGGNYGELAVAFDVTDTGALIVEEEKPVVPVEPEIVENITISANVAVKSTIAITYRITGASSYNNFYLDISADRISSADGFNAVPKSEKIEKASMTAAGSLYAVQYSGIAMYELNVPLVATLYITDDAGNVIAKSNPYTTSVKQLAVNLYNTTKEAATKTIVSDLLAVGTQAQKYFETAGSDLEGLDYPTDDFVGSPSTTYGELATTNSDANSTNVTTAINLAVNPGIRYGFKNCSSAANLKVVFSYYDAVQKKNVVTTVGAADMTLAGGVYYYRYQDITFYSGATTVTATVYDGETVLYTHDYCLETILAKNKNTASMKDLVDAIIKFGKACQAYYL